MANNWAIAVGINNYEFLPDASLRYADRDALAMRQFLRDRAGFQAEKVLLCGNAGEGRKIATRAVLRNILLNDLRRAETADNLWFFFSGHGMAGNDQQDYLMTVDANPEDLHETAISIHFVTDRLRACRAKNIVLILDMCRTESRDPGRKSAESVADSLRQLVKDREGQQGIITLFSCGRGESSYEIAELERGAFTYALLEGLQQHAILKDLEAYLNRRVTELHQSYPSSGKLRKQVPLIIPEPGWKYEEPILTNYATAGDVSRLKDLALDAEHDRDIDKAIRLWEQVNLLASDNNDRRRALTRILHLSKQSPSSTITTPPSPVIDPPVEPTPQPGFPPLKVIEFTSLKLDPQGNIVAQPTHTAESFAEALGNGICLTMVKIPAGEFMMGSPEHEQWRRDNESPQHLVRVPEFYIGQTLVTQAQWQQMMGNTPSHFTCDVNLPVEQACWLDATEFCQKLSQRTQREYRLPSEAEWEYACRAGTKTPFYFGETISSEVANYCAQDRKYGDTTYPGKYGDGKLGEFRHKTTPVDKFSPNSFGLYDMHGNLWEWCLDTWHNNYHGAPTDGSPWIAGDSNSFYVLRGGSWDDNPRFCCSATRTVNIPVTRRSNFGFRVICEIPRTL